MEGSDIARSRQTPRPKFNSLQSALHHSFHYSQNVSLVTKFSLVQKPGEGFNKLRRNPEHFDCENKGPLVTVVVTCLYNIFFNFALNPKSILTYYLTHLISYIIYIIKFLRALNICSCLYSFVHFGCSVTYWPTDGGIIKRPL